ncbi:MAG: nucleoside transporter [Neolewinella sp.]|jgi:nucleoside transporter
MSTTFRLSALQFLQNAVFATSVISLSTYMLQTLGFSGREVGMVYATNAIAATVAPPVVGWLADRHFSADRMLVLLNVLAAVAITACFFATSFWAVYVFILVFNLCFIPTFGLLAAICFHQLETPAKSFPAVRAWGTVSFMFVGLGLSYFGVENSPWPLVAGGVMAIITAITALSLPRVPPQPGFNFSMLTGPEVSRIIREPGMIVLLLAVIFSCVPASFYYSFVNPFLNEIGWSAAAAKMSLGQLVEIGVVVSMPFVFRRMRFRRIVFWGLLLWGLRYFLFSFARPDNYEFLLYLGIAVQGIAFAWIVIAAQIYVDNRVPVALRSTAQGLVSFANQGVGIFIGSWIAGEVVLANTLPGGGHDWSVIWLVPGVVGVLAAVGFWVFFPRASKL